jgi:hypothetical protein
VGSLPAAIVPAADGKLWFTDESQATAIGRVATGAPAAVKARPSITGTPAPGHTLICAGARWATWARLKPSLRLFGFDGYRWLRGGVPLAGTRGRTLTVTAADRGHRLSCRETATYPAPFSVTAVATSATARVL